MTELNTKIEAIFKDQPQGLKDLVIKMVKTDKEKVRELMYNLIETNIAKSMDVPLLDEDVINTLTDEAMDALSNM